MEKKQFQLRNEGFSRSEHDFKCGLFKDCLTILGTKLSPRSARTSEACVGHTLVCTCLAVSAFVCTLAPAIRPRCLILCSYPLLSIRAFMGRCCQSYHGNQSLWQCVASPQGCGWSITAQYILKIQNLQRPGTETISMKYLAALADSCCWWTQLLLNFLALYESLRLFWMLTDSFDNMRKLQKCLAGRSSNLLEASPELYFQITCSHTFTSCFRILSNENVWVNNLLFFYNTLYGQSCPDFFKYLDLVVGFTWVVNWNESYHWKCRGHVLCVWSLNLKVSGTRGSLYMKLVHGEYFIGWVLYLRLYI